ncbi:LuxR C-terminal-related transcriptional regulator [Pantoea agglomerans]
MVSIYSNCLLTRCGLDHLFSVMPKPPKKKFVFMDLRAFYSMPQLYYTATEHLNRDPFEALVMIYPEAASRYNRERIFHGFGINASLTKIIDCIHIADKDTRPVVIDLIRLKVSSGVYLLTYRQQEALQLVLRGYNVDLIARTMSISKKTAYSYLDAIRKVFREKNISHLYSTLAPPLL